MKISEQEVSRLLYASPFERTGNTSSSVNLEGRAHLSRYTDQGDISTTAHDIQRITQLINRLPHVREDRVQALKAQIDNGTYHVSGEDIADLMIRRLLADNTAI